MSLIFHASKVDRQSAGIENLEFIMPYFQMTDDLTLTGINYQNFILVDLECFSQMYSMALKYAMHLFTTLYYILRCP